ncbi:MAG TPA: 16S rRNA (guanine(966)-N(2))-methyltransferase RsmD [Dehalococcoidales bacterium]|nr:16S rRNA (guanine(966)-N(2))-methyltransferase RsmD [Dehalococcoidales bacterium]
MAIIIKGNMLRVITGKAKGHQLKVPTGVYVRPATDLVRGAIFSILENSAVQWEYVLDLFAGSGALGIEALSRGAGWVDFVDRERRCCDIIRQNLEKTKLSVQAHVYSCSVARAFSFLDKEYSIVLMDPPYADTSIGSVVTKLADSRLVGADSIVVVTHSPRLTLEPAYGSLSITKEHRHGDSCIAVYRKG